MKLPEGRLLRSRVVSTPRTVLVEALDRTLDGYAVLEPQQTLLLDDAGAGVLTFEDGVPVAAYHTGTDNGGPRALADLAANGPYRLELFQAPTTDLAAVHDTDSFRVPPAMPADRLAGDPELTARTRNAAPEDAACVTATDRDDVEETEQVGAVEAFLDDAEKIEAIRERAREEATQRAEEWDIDIS